MPSRTHRERVLEVLRLYGRPLDDDQLAARAGISPRQSVNQVCRALEASGLIRRYAGVDRKIVNELVSGPDPAAQAALSVSSAGAAQYAPDEFPLVMGRAEAGLPPGSSEEQRAAEAIMLEPLSTELSVRLSPRRIGLPSGARVEVDGADLDRTILVECWAHQGSPKAAQRHKVLSDALKLTWISSTLYPRPRLFLCLSDDAAAAPFLPSARTWAAQALQDLSIAVVVVTLPRDIRDGLVAAQKRQYR